MFNQIRKWINNIGSYRMTTDSTSYQYPAYIVEVQGLTHWHIVKIFINDDTEYARLCAMELLEKLEEEI